MQSESPRPAFNDTKRDPDMDELINSLSDEAAADEASIAEVEE